MRVLAANSLTLRRPGGASADRAPAVNGADAGTGDRPPTLAIRWVLLTCLALSALTLLFPSAPTYDPWAWLLWGREIAHLDLVTEGGPSWKPLPVLFNVPFSVFGADAAPYLWLWIARAGALLALAMSFRLARRLVGRGAAGVVAGLMAAAFLLTTYQYVRDSALGNSEALLAGLFLWGFERHLDGRRDHALYLGLAVALLRPETWPFLGLYGLWLFVREPELRLRVVLVGLAIPILWFGPELWGSGEPFRASSRAGRPNPGSAAFADHPGLEVAKRFVERAVIPLQVGGLIAVAMAARAWIGQRRQGAILALSGLGIAWILLVAVMTERGFAGNQRYLIVTTAVLCVLGGIGIGRVFDGLRQLVGRRTSERAALRTAFAIFAVGALALSPVIKAKVDNVSETLDELRYEASLWHTLPGVIDQAGGPSRVLSCGNIYSGPFQTQMVAYELGVHGIGVGDVRPLKESPAPGAIFRTNTVPGGPLVATVTDKRFREAARSGRWRIWTAPRSDARGRACPSPSADAPRVPPTARTTELSSSR